MLKRKVASCILVVLLLALALLPGCGGGGDSSTVAKSAGAANGGKAFLKYTQQKQIVAFGKEAPNAEREAASAVLAQNFKARAAADFTAQCDSLGKTGLEAVVGTGISGLTTSVKKCPEILSKLAKPLKSTKSIRADTLSGPIAALRIKGDKAYALFHGNDGHDYAMAMEKEAGNWRVGGLVATPLG